MRSEAGRCHTREQELTACNDEKQKTTQKAIRAGKCIGFTLSSILITGIIYLVGMILIRNIQAVEVFYSNNQFVFWLGGILISPLISWLLSLFKKLKIALTSLGKRIYTWIFKSYKIKLEDTDKKLAEIQTDIDGIQTEIESKLVLHK